jgi:hypothetical protein
MIYYQLIFSCLIILNQTQINIIKKNYIRQLINNSMKHVIRDNSTAFMLYCMNAYVYLTILLVSSNNISFLI